jgi:hypothetical protein
VRCGGDGSEGKVARCGETGRGFRGAAPNCGEVGDRGGEAVRYRRWGKTVVRCGGDGSEGRWGMR